MLFVVLFAALAQASLFQPSKANVQRCFDLTSDQDPNFFECLQSLVCKVPIPTMSSYNTTTPTPSPSPTPSQSACSACDCSHLDKNSDDYFNCVTDPNCDRCINTSSWSWSNSSTPITTPPPTPSSSSSSSYETMVPGTYTFVSNGTTRVMVVPAAATATGNTTAQIVTVTLTTILTVPAHSETTSSGPTQRVCPKFCDCAKIKDKSSDGYFQCLTNPACEHCSATATRITSKATSTSKSTTKSISASTSATSSASASATVEATSASQEPCSDDCNCDNHNPQSAQYMACIEKEECKHCVKRRWFRRFWARDY